MSKKQNADDRLSKYSSDRVIGWREVVVLPQLKIDKIKVKIDTGARSSALHAFNIREFKRDEKDFVRFQVHPLQRDRTVTITSEAELLEYRQVKNSGGGVQLRPVIITEIKLGENSWAIELTLTNRDVMGFRMLLGRQAVRNKFLIDPGRSFLQSRRKR